MPVYKVEQLAQECGISRSGFMDITETRDLNPEGIKEEVKNRLDASPFPSGPKHQNRVNGLISNLIKNNLKIYNDKLSSYFTRYYSTETGKQAAHWIYSEMESYKSGRTDISINFFEHSWLQPSVIARIQGTGKYADEVVVIGAHEDSIGAGGASGRAPGSDDDASGTSTVLELFRLLATSGFKPNRSIEFHAYSAEEVGLRGSQAIAQVYQKEGVIVYSQMQLDMTSYVKPGTNPVIGIITDYVNSDLTKFLQSLVPAYTNLGFSTSKCGYACSDHASWTKAGYASCHPFESLESNINPKIHTSQDVFNILNLDHGLEFAKLGVGYLVELSLVN